jgi:hypothetical protein
MGEMDMEMSEADEKEAGENSSITYFINSTRIQ